MFISLNWIKEYVNLDGIEVEDLLNKFTLSCAEIEGVEYKGKQISGVVSGKIVSVEDHPNSKKLHLLKVFDGKENIDVVCGAPNVREGLIIPFAQIGAKIGDVTIASAVVGGYKSNGMCCSAKELGLTDDNSGLMELPNNTPIGKDIKELFGVEDVIFEVDNKSLTNRPDMWGHYGIAREIAAITNRKLKAVDVYEKQITGKAPSVIVNTPECYRYTSATMDNVTRKVSPVDMQIRLYYVGMRPINFLADVTNYVMLELGQPMHAFDNNYVKSINVEQLKSEEKFTTLDGVERILPPDTIVIKNQNETVAVAGIMGGLDSEILPNTTSVLIESACFNGINVRKTSLALGLRSEASARYEKMLDPNLTMTCLLRYIYLITKYDSNACITSGISDVYNYHYPQINVEISKEYIDNMIGNVIPEAKILNILESLELKVIENKNSVYKIAIPSFRATKDITGKQDIIEEIGRIYGYDNIVPTAPQQVLEPRVLDKNIRLDYDIKYCLASKFDLNETHSYLWYDSESNKKLNINPYSCIRVINAINKENDKLRSTMIPSLLKVVLDNKNELNEIGTFEIGRTIKHLDENNQAVENKSLGIVLYSKKKTYEQLLLKLKDIVDYVLENVCLLNVEYKLNENPSESYLSPVNNYAVVLEDKEIGFVSPLHPTTKACIDKKCECVVCELDFNKIINAQTKINKFEKVSKFPKTTLDFNFVVASNGLYSHINEIAHSIKTSLNYNVSLLDIYDNGESKSYTLRYEVFSYEKTLIGEEIETFHKTVIDTFAKNNIMLKEV